MNMKDVAAIVWKDCIRAKPGEKALVVCDPSGERLEIGGILKEACPCPCDIVTMKPTGLAGREPTPEVAMKMLEYDILIAPTQHSVTHTKAVAALLSKGGRAITMPCITKGTFIRAINIDYSAMAETNARLSEALSGGSRLRVRTKAGTDITMDMAKGRKINSSDGILRPGRVKNLPDGEVAIAPKEGSANGVIAFDLSSLGRRLEKPFRVAVREGVAVECGNKELWDIISKGKDRSNLAELGIGTNPMAKITGNILEDEKVIGTAHIAFGTSAAFGGLVQSDVHLDSVFDRPTIDVDGKIIIKEGKFLF